MRFRRATLEDAQPLFVWRKDPASMLASVNGNSFTWDSHVAWLEKTLERTDRRLFIAELSDKKIGTVRFDANGETEELSWTVAPECRKQGLGAIMVQCSLPLATLPLIAKIKRENIASQKIAAHAGFALVDDGELQTWKLSLKD